MRLTGWILLLIGALACATIAWAALGFLLMGVGLIALQVAERRKRRADVAPAGTTGLTPPKVGAGLQPPVFEPVPHDGAPQRLPHLLAWPAPSSEAPYDRAAWRRLVESDGDLAQIADVLADYGPQYVDELAASYLAMPDKSRLEAIVDGIIARARDAPPAPPPAPTEASRPPPQSRSVAAPEETTPRPAAIKPPTLKPAAPLPAAPPPPLPANPTDALEASLIAAVEASAAAKAAAERSDPGGTQPSQRAAFGRAAREPRPDRPPSVPTPPSADIEASLIAAVTEAAAKRADPPKPAAPPELAPAAAKPEPEIRRAPSGLKPVAAPPVPPAKPPGKTAADDLDESLLAALAEISGENRSKAEAASKDPPADDELSEMIKKFAPDSSFLRKQ